MMFKNLVFVVGVCNSPNYKNFTFFPTVSLAWVFFQLCSTSCMYKFQGKQIKYIWLVKQLFTHTFLRNSYKEKKEESKWRKAGKKSKKLRVKRLNVWNNCIILSVTTCFKAQIYSLTFLHQPTPDRPTDEPTNQHQHESTEIGKVYKR